jgi:UDP-N-acetylmuramoylalanine--D-glutamate ligase
VIIFGLGQEGRSTYQTIRTYLPTLKIVAVDDAAQEDLGSEWQNLFASDEHILYLQGTANESTNTPRLHAHLTQEEIIVLKTPGIPFTNQFFLQLSTFTKSTGKRLVFSSNVELFFASIHSLPEVERPRTIGITGTKGKSTTTALINHVLKEAGKTVFLAGNIGVPALDLLDQLLHFDSSEVAAGQQKPQVSDSFIVLELSSHQLQQLPYSPHIAVVQNITPEHLDYYKDFEDYVAAKAPIAAHQSERDYIIYNPEYEIPRRFARNSHAQKLPYSLHLIPQTKESEEFLLSHPGESQVVAYYKDEALWYETEAICSVQDLPLKGEHNILNTFPAIIVAKLMGISAAQVQAAISTFTSLPHRLEFVAEKSGVAYYNDSQGTTPEASIAAMRSFPGKQLILLAGGSDKGVPFDELAQEILTQNVSHILLFPPTGAKIAAAVEHAFGQSAGATTKAMPQLQTVNSMQEAVALATQAAQPGSVVLLSPACASFGLFKNYQDRGNQFKQAVLQNV